MMHAGGQPLIMALTTALPTNPHSIDRDVRMLQEALRVVLGGAPSGDGKERLRATEWLRSFRSRDDAWDACVAVLGAQRGVEQNQVSLDEQVFASQALLYKCRRRRAQITSDDVGCLLRLALAFTRRGLRPVLTQLCLGVCACAVRHSGWEPSKVLPDMVLYCQQASGDAGPGDPGPRLLMLEILTVLPDEAASKSGLNAHPERRSAFLRALRDPPAGCGRLALGVLSQLLEPGALVQEGARAAILRCALSWVQLEAIDRETLFASPVMAVALESLESLEACDDACELVTVTVEAFTEPGAVRDMLPRILSRTHALVNPPSEDVCRCLGTVFSTAACAYLPCIFHAEFFGHWSSLLQVMVAMLEHESLEIAVLALDFWGLLGELLTEAVKEGQGQRSSQLEESMRRACVVAILRAQYPGVDEGGLIALDADARDELEDFRDQVQELLQTLILPAIGPESSRDSGLGSSAPTKTCFPSSPGGRNSYSGSASPSWNSLVNSGGAAAAISLARTGSSGTAGFGQPYGLALSPVQADLLSWLETFAAASTREALTFETFGDGERGIGEGGGGGASNGHGTMMTKSAGTAAALTSLSRFDHLADGEMFPGADGGMAAGRSDKWTRVEVLLRVLSAVAKAFVIRDGSNGTGTPNDFVLPPDGGVGGQAGALEAVVAALSALPPRKRELQRSVAVMVGGLAPWLARRPESLEPAFKAVVRVLELEEEGTLEGEIAMRDKGEEHVGVVALSKLAAAAGASLAAIPTLPTHLLELYLDLSRKLQYHRLRSASAPLPPPPASIGSRGAIVESGRLGAGGGQAEHRTWTERVSNSGQNGDPGVSRGGEGGGGWPEFAPPPPLHASSLRLFLGSLCRMLGESNELGSSASAGGNPEAAFAGGNFPGNGIGNGSRATGSVVELQGSGEREEALRRLVESEARWLGWVLDRQRQAGTPVLFGAHGTADENRAIGELARDSLANIALILRKSGPMLNGPGLVARYCGSRGAGTGGGLVVDLVDAYGEGGEKISAGICQVFETLVWSIAEQLRRAGCVPESNGNGYTDHHGNGSTLSNGLVNNGHVVGRPRHDHSDALRLAVALGDALAEAFLQRPFARFLDALRCVTKELATFGRHPAEGDGGSGRNPNLSLRACEWVNRCLWSAANSAAAAAAAAATNAPKVGTAGGVVFFVGGGGGADARPELMEASFKLMSEWVKELPVPSLRWLDSWLMVAVSGMAVRHRGPGRSVLQLIQACCAQKSDANFVASFSRLLRETTLGVAITRGLLSGLCGAMPSWMLDDLVATIRALFDALNPASVSVWVEAVLQDPGFERYGVGDDVKVAFARKLKEDLCCKDWRAFKAGLKAFCGGKKKGTTGTPPVHASAVNRHQQHQHQAQQTSTYNPSEHHSVGFPASGGGVVMSGIEDEAPPSLTRSMTM